MTLEEMNAVVAAIEFPEYSFRVGNKGTAEQPAYFLQACYMEPDIITGELTEQRTRKWLLSEHAVESELVQTALKLMLTSMEHRTREHFKYKGERVFSPHFDINFFVQAARERRLDYRGKKKSA